MKRSSKKPGDTEGYETYSIYNSPVGQLYIVAIGEILTEISFKEPLLDRGPIVPFMHDQLDEYFSRKRKRFELNTLFLNATAFEKRVYECLLSVPYGQTRTYTWIAQMAGSPRGARAAGQALRKNPIPIVYPCHRITAVDGSLGGYTPSVEIKTMLLEREGAVLGRAGISCRDA